MTKKWLVPIQVFIVLASVAGAIYVALTPANSLMNWYSVDDAFFYYKVAQNALLGHGFTFDGINLSNGFHPLWMVVCLGVFWLSRFNLILPLRVLVIVSGILNAATVLVLFRLLIKHIHPAAAIIAALSWGLLPRIFTTVTLHGMESSISAFFLVLLFSTASGILISAGKIRLRQIVIAGLFGGLTVLARLDNIFIVAMVGLFLMFRITRVPRKLIYDLIIISLAIIISWVIRFGLAGFRTNTYSIYPMLGVAIMIKPITYYFCGMYQNFKNKKLLYTTSLQLLAAVITLTLMYSIMFGMNHFGVLPMFSRSVIAMDAAICSILIFFSRLVERKIVSTAFSPAQQAKEWFKSAWKDSLLRGATFAGPIALLLGVYITFNKIIFGSFAPVSGQIKVWWNTLPNTVYAQSGSLLKMLGLDPSGGDGPWSLFTSRVNDVAVAIMKLLGRDTSFLRSAVFLILFLFFSFLVLFVLNLKPVEAGKKAFTLLLPALLLGCVFQIAYYNTVGYEGIRQWYWVAQMLMIIMTTGLVLDPIFSWLDRYKPTHIWSIVVAFLVVSLICSKHINLLIYSFPVSVSAENEGAYLKEIKEVENFTERGSKIGMTGGGLVGYFIQDRTVVNLDGLINSNEYFSAMKAGTAKSFLDAIPLDYVYGQSYMLEESDPYKDILGGRLVKIGIIRGYDNFTLYHYEPNQ
jgi:hypothetical protein